MLGARHALGIGGASLTAMQDTLEAMRSSPRSVQDDLARGETHLGRMAKLLGAFATNMKDRLDDHEARRLALERGAS